MLEIAAASAKLLLYAGALAAAGVVFAWATLLAALGEHARRAPQLIRLGASVALVGAVANILILAIRLGGMFDEPTLAAIRESPAGLAAILQAAGALALIAFAGISAVGGAVRIAGGVALVGSFAVNGHAASVDFVSSVIAFVHVAAAAWWLGALMLLGPACRSMHGEALAAVVKRFSQAALAVVANLLAAGVLLILTLVDFTRAEWFTPYAQVLGVKVALAGCVLALAAFNKWRLTPRIAAGDAEAARSLAISIRIEAGVIAGVLCATAILTTYTSPHA